MSRRLPLILALVGLFAGLTLATTPSYAAKPVAKITSFQGEVRVLAGSTIRPVKQKGVVLNHGDRVQTEQGTVEVTFLDGATMKVRPYTTAMIQEQEEETGWWIFKGKQAVRAGHLLCGKALVQERGLRSQELPSDAKRLCVEYAARTGTSGTTT